MNTEIIIFLNQRRLREGLTQLKAYAEKVNNWDILSTIETLQTNYEYMLKYAAEGQADPQRQQLFNDILSKSFELTDQLHLEEKYTNGYGYMADLYRVNKIKPIPSFSDLQEELISLNEKEGIQVTEENQTEHDLFKPHFEFIDKVFKKTLISAHWSASEYSEAYNLIYCGMSTFDLEVWLAAVTLSLLNCFDTQKFNFLLNVYLGKSIVSIKARALVGITLAIYYYNDRIKLNDDCSQLLDFLLNGNEEVPSQIQLIQQLFLLSRETEKIDKKMREEIIPQMMKNPYLKHTDKKFEEIELKELEEDNPEWKQDLDKMSKQMHELGELQREGADTYMSTFAMLKHYQFFREISHWFYPFSTAEPSINKILKEKEVDDHSILHMMLNSPAFCNSDKYSFCLALDDIPLQEMSMMKENVKNREDFLNDQLGAPSNLDEEEKVKITYRQYLHDLYRFCKLWPSRKEQHDIFTDSLNLWKKEEMRQVLLSGESGIKMANYLLSKGYYEEANEFYNVLHDEFPIDTELIQKAGFALQKMKKYEEAIRVYNQGYILNPQDTWTLKHMAHCYKKIHDEEKALKFFQLANNLEPDNLNLTLQVGQCLASLERFDEALKCFFKVEYLGKMPDNARRAIAWCYFMTGKNEDATRFYEKIIHESTPTMNDWMNYGHVFLVQGNLKEALKCYQKTASTCKTHDEFINLFAGDTQILINAGVDITTLYIIQDLV